jgi:hypothetical protein
LGADALSVGPHERREVAPLSCRRPLQPQQTRRVDRDPHVPHHNHSVVLTVFPRCPCARRGRNQWPCAQSHHHGQNAQSHDLHGHTRGARDRGTGLQVYVSAIFRQPCTHATSSTKPPADITHEFAPCTSPPTAQKKTVISWAPPTAQDTRVRAQLVAPALVAHWLVPCDHPPKIQLFENVISLQLLFESSHRFSSRDSADTQERHSCGLLETGHKARCR